MNPQKVFETGLMYHHYANTAYPLTPGSFREYRIGESGLYGDFLKSEWAKTDALSLYVHIPFCSVRCKFCEYTVLPEWTAEAEEEYVGLLLREIGLYRSVLEQKTIEGFDVGGGTPTRISVQNLSRITDAVRSGFSFRRDLVASIETTPVIAAKEPEKIKAVFDLGYARMSMGIQTVSEKLLNELGREGSTHVYEQAVRNIRAAGFRRFNIDLMYGFLHQTDDYFEATLRYAISLEPEYITLYRNRYKGTKLENEAAGVSLFKIITQYRLAYRILTEAGYDANPGKNTFSRLKDDCGTSDYLTRRVIEGLPYVGMGLGAQSCGVDYLAYNAGAASKRMDEYRAKTGRNEFPIQDIYRLPLRESMAKMVSVSFYFGFVDRDMFARRFSTAFESVFPDEIAYVLDQGLMEWRGVRLSLTARGADYINGIIPLFYSDRSKEELLTLATRAKTRSSGEKEFLAAYRLDDYARPSVTVDIAVIKKTGGSCGAGDARASVLMIRRGEHPCMGMWALPGGFVRPGESVEDAALRELKDESGVSGADLNQLGVFSAPGRDPRGWIISCAFAGEITGGAVSPVFGDDAVDAGWFEVKLDQAGKLVSLVNGENVLSPGDIAFDHAEIIRKAITKLNGV